MPRPKKPAGQAVDPRNGRRAELPAAATGEVPGIKRFGLPRRETGWLPETSKAWRALWADPVASALTPVDRPVLLRWADALDRAARALVDADQRPAVKGSMGQQVENPLYGVADKAIRVAQACEAQIGVGALNRARLGIAILAERATLDQVNARYVGGGNVDEPDPRLG